MCAGERKQAKHRQAVRELMREHPWLEVSICRTCPSLSQLFASARLSLTWWVTLVQIVYNYELEPDLREQTRLKAELNRYSVPA